MAIYNVVESTNMGTTHFAERILDAVADVDVENGTFGYLEELADGFSHVYKFVAGTKKGCKVVMVDQPAWDADTCKTVNQRKDKFVCKAGVPFRVRTVKEGDEFATAVEGFTPATKDKAEADKYVTIDATTGKLVVADAPVEDAVMNGKIMRTRIMGGTLVTVAHNYGYSRKMYEVKVEALA